MKTTFKIFIAAISLFISHLSYSQQQLTIEQCYQLAEQNYPLAKQRDLIRQTAEYNIDNISKGIYPQFGLTGSATYQSDVTKIDINIPNLPVNIPSMPKDQYKIYGEVSQSLTDFPLNKAQRDLKKLESDIQEQNINVELYKLHERINNLFFGVLLIDEQLKQSGLVQGDINRGIKQTEAAIKNGTAFRSNLDKLKAELLKIDQKDIELTASRKAYTDMLGLFIGRKLDSSTVFVKPALRLSNDSINRPELKTYSLQKIASAAQDKLLKLRNIPKVNAFFQGGVGRPNPFNILSSKFSPYYITGVQLKWSPTGLYTLKKEKEITANDRAGIDVLQNTFLFNTNVQLSQQNADIQKYLDLIETDNEIIALRESVKNTSVVQLENGVITTNDYLKEVNEEDQARQNLILHNLQLLMIQYQQKVTTGN